MTICPCCGFKFKGALSSGCKQCGARAVGAALPKPAHELPSYGRALLLGGSGSVMVIVFVTQTIIAMFQRPADWLGFWSWVAAGETAAWRLKWVSIPVMFITLLVGRRLYRSIKQQPERFCGLRHARNGLIASATVALLIALLIGITVPARLRHRQLAREASIQALAYTYDRAFFSYQLRYGTLPAEIRDLKKLPDPDGSIAVLLREVETDQISYSPRADLAAVAQPKRPSLQGALIRKASLSTATDDLPPGGLSFTNYDLRLAGEDKLLGTEDDWVGRDGVIMRLSDVAKGGVGRSVSAGALQP